MQPESSKPAAVTAIANFSDVSFIGILEFQSRARRSRRETLLPRHDSTFNSHIIAEFDDISSAGMLILHCGSTSVSFLPQVLERPHILRQ
jgi:hypothetical protein